MTPSTPATTQVFYRVTFHLDPRSTVEVITHDPDYLLGGYVAAVQGEDTSAVLDYVVGDRGRYLIPVARVAYIDVSPVEGYQHGDHNRHVALPAHTP